MICGKWVAAFLAGAALSTGNIGYAMSVTHEVVVQPIQVCYDGGADCGDMALFFDGSVEGFADQMFGLAGLDVRFLPSAVLGTTRDGDIGEHLGRFGTEAGFDPLNGRTVVPAFFDPMFAPPGTVGLAWVGAGGLVANTSAFAIVTTFAHELGHNLGLTHYFDLGKGSTNNLMDYGLCAVGNCSLADSQIAQLRGDFEADSFAFVYSVSSVPEPGLLSMWFAGGLAFAWRLRGRGRGNRRLPDRACVL